MADQISIVKTERGDGEKPLDFARRLEAAGATEMARRKALVRQFGLGLPEVAEVTAQFEGMRLREIEGDMRRHPQRRPSGRIAWVMRNFCVDRAEAERHVDLVTE